MSETGMEDTVREIKQMGQRERDNERQHHIDTHTHTQTQSHTHTHVGSHTHTHTHILHTSSWTHMVMDCYHTQDNTLTYTNTARLTQTASRNTHTHLDFRDSPPSSQLCCEVLFEDTTKKTEKEKNSRQKE